MNATETHLDGKCVNSSWIEAQNLEVLGRHDDLTRG